MTKIYPNLSVEQHGKVMRLAFWLFSLTCGALLLAVIGIQAGLIAKDAAELIRSLMGPLLGINIGLLFYLADRDWGVIKRQKTNS